MCAPLKGSSLHVFYKTITAQVGVRILHLQCYEMVHVIMMSSGVPHEDSARNNISEGISTSHFSHNHRCCMIIVIKLMSQWYIYKQGSTRFQIRVCRNSREISAFQRTNAK